MQVAFQRRLIFLVLKGICFIFSFLLILSCLILSGQYPFFIYFSIILLLVTAFLGLTLVLDILWLRSFDWGLIENEPDIVLPVGLSLDDLALKACNRYANRATYTMIRKELGLTQNTQVRRLIQEGLASLLKEHAESCNSSSK